MDKLLFIIVTAVVVAALTGMTRLSRQLEQGATHQTQAWRVSITLAEVGRWMTIAGGALIAPFVFISLPLEVLYPAVYLPTLGKVLATMTVMGGVVLAVATFVVTSVLLWRVVQRFGARTLLRKGQHAIQARLTVNQSQKTLKFIGHFCFAVCVVTLQLFGGLVLLVLKGALEAKPEKSEDDGFLTEGTFYNYASGRYDNGCKVGGRYHDDD